MVDNAGQHMPARNMLTFFFFALVACGLYASSIYSYLLFHSLVEVICVVVILTIFVLAWNSRRFLDNHYILFLGISLLSSAAFELVHMFAFKGFGVFPGNDANLPAQLWIASRYVFSLSFLIAPVFITRRLNAAAMLTVFTVFTALLFTAIFSGHFPDCYIEGKGLTPFKVYSEYVIIIVLFAALGLLLRKRTLFDPRILKMLVLSIVSAAAAEAAFTSYLRVYGPANLVGHLFLFLSAVLIYRAIIVTGVEEPRAIIFRNLEQSEKQFRLIAQTSVDLIFQLDVSGKVVFCSPAIVQYGYSIAEVIGKDFSVYIAHDDLERATSAFKRSIGGEFINALQLCMLSADGTPYYVEINIAPVTVNGAVIGLQGISRDVTSRKQAEEELKKLNEELEIRVAMRTAELREKDQLLLLQSRHAAMGEMINNIAHQWRQPLNALGLRAQQLLLFYEIGGFTKEFLEENVSRSMEIIQHMSKTIDDFRNYFSPDKEKIEFNALDAIMNTLALIEDNFKNQRIDIEVVAKEKPVINGYRNEFAQVILNILNNARDALIERSVDSPKVTIMICCEGERAVVTIADNAGGIPEEIIDKIFDPYFTTKGLQQGTGVGLFMSKNIIEKNMDGRLVVRNTGNGAEFRIEV